MTTNATAETKAWLVPETRLEECAAGPSVDLAGRAGTQLLLVLRVTEIIEQESLHVSVWGSPDGTTWGRKPIFIFPQIFYAGATPAALDLTQRPDIKFLQARWEVNRWGRGYPRPHFVVSLEIQDLNPGR